MSQASYRKPEEDWVYPQGKRSGWFQCEHLSEHQLGSGNDWICRVCGYIPGLAKRAREKDQARWDQLR